MYKIFRMKNGLRVITIPYTSTQAVTVLVLAKVGSKYERKDINGISHFLEHMMFKGTKKRPTPVDIAETLDRIGGSYNAFTGEEYTGYFAKVEASHLDLALDWVSDIFLNSTLPKKEIEKEKGVIVEEINMYLDNPMLYVQNLWKKVLYGDQPAGWDIAGTKSNVRAMSRQKLSAYRQKYYTASNSIVCVAGKIDSQKVVAKVRKCFEPILPGKKVIKPAVREKQSKPHSLVHYKKTDQTHLCLGVRTYNLFHPHRFTLSVLADILGGMMSSRLFVRIREELGLAYYISTANESDPDTGFLVTQAGVDNKNVSKAIQGILKEYKRIKNEKVPSAELEKAKNHLKGKLALSLESSDSLASFYGIQEILMGKILSPKDVFKKVDKVSQEDVLRVASEVFRPNRLNLAVIGPFKNKEKFDRLMFL